MSGVCFALRQFLPMTWCILTAVFPVIILDDWVNIILLLFDPSDVIISCVSVEAGKRGELRFVTCALNFGDEDSSSSSRRWNVTPSIPLNDDLIAVHIAGRICSG